eukprot:gene6029-9262_t
MDGEVSVPGVNSIEEARAFARSLVREHQRLGIPEVGRAATAEEAFVKARMLLALESEQAAVDFKRNRARCKGSLPHVDGATARPAFVGDKVMVHKDPAFVRRMIEQGDHLPGWNDLIIPYCGVVGTIAKILSVDVVKVTFNDTESWLLPSSCLTRTQQTDALQSPRRRCEQEVRAPAQLPFLNSYKVLLVADTVEALEDCQTAHRFLLDQGFSPTQGTRVVGPDTLRTDATGCARVVAEMEWLVAGAQAGDGLFLFLSVSAGGDGLPGVAGADLVRPLYRLPKGARLTAIVAAHSCGGGGALLDLPFTLSGTREGGFTSTERPVAGAFEASITVLGTWNEPGVAAEDLEEVPELLSSFVRAFSVAAPPPAQQFVKDARAILVEKYGAAAPLPRLASSVPFTVISLFPAPRLPRTVADAPMVPYRDYTSLAASRLPPPARQGKCVALGDADARAWVIFCMRPTPAGTGDYSPGAEAPAFSRVAVYNGHPCFMLHVYNWLENDEVAPVGETIMTQHHSKTGLVYQISVAPGETKEFIEGVLSDGEAWRPGWWQSAVDAAVMEKQELVMKSDLIHSHAKTRAVFDILADASVPLPDTAFSCVSLVEAALEVRDTDCPHYDVYFPPDASSVNIAVSRVFSPEFDVNLHWARPQWYSARADLVLLCPSQDPQGGARGAVLPNDITPGKLSNPSFLSAMACVAEAGGAAIGISFSNNPNPDEYLAKGACRMQACVKGWWHDITVDTCLPVVRRPLSSVVWIPAGAHSVKAAAPLWPAMLEKGAAKVYGSYGDLLASADGVPEMLEMLTGGWVTRHVADGAAHFAHYCAMLDGGETVVFLTRPAAPSAAPRERFGYAMIDYDRDKRAVCVRDVWDGGKWKVQTDACRKVQGGRWIPYGAIPSVFETFARVHVREGGELRLWVAWDGDYPSTLTRVTVTCPTVVRVAAIVQLQDAPAYLPVSLFSRSGNGLHEHRTSANPFEVTLFPRDGPVYISINCPPPCDEGAVLVLLY